ncbi:DUF2490 domain-containing protein [Sphingobacterium sp. HJSM2_6]|uniref:DUF2490 domain-containing protein n=1 Tax=Sphingobacterium sp. HJSM2_6 TaxID=3366264 RepID=UPI003BBB99C1
MRKLLLISTFLFLVNSSFGQSTKGWLIYFGQSNFKNSKFNLHHELQIRDHQVIGDHQQTLGRIAGQYKWKPYFQVSLGYAYGYSEAEGEPNLPFSEHRIYQEGLFSHKVSKLGLRHRIRVEERFVEGQEFQSRFRYCLFLDIPLTNKEMNKGGVYLAFYDELFLNIDNPMTESLFDRNRAYAGLGFKAKDQLGLQLGYMMQHVGKSKLGNHLLLSIHQQINW